MMRTISCCRPFASVSLAVAFVFMTASEAVAQGTRDSIINSITGPVRSIAQAASISRLQIDSIITQIPASTLGQLLSGRFAGLQAMSTGPTGTGSRIRIRGQSSLLLGNDPLIIVDGVRSFQVPNNASSPVPSRADDINIEDIEEIEILRGAASTTLYGSGAANGVVIVTTKHGARGKTRFDVYTENGLISDPHTYPDLWSLWGKRTGQSMSSLCTLALVSAKTCVVDSLSHGNVLNIDSLTPIGRGYRSQYGLQVSGGSKRVQFFVAGEREDETGVFKMPARDIAQLKSERGVASLPSNQVRPSVLARNYVRANLSIQPWSKMSLQLSNAHVNGDARFATSDENSVGLGYASTGGQWRLDLLDGLGRPLAGYVLSAGDVMSQVSSQGIDRYVNGISATLTPFRWLSARVAYGRDATAEVGRSYTRRDEGPGNSSVRTGHAVQSRAEFTSQTFDFGATANHRLTSWLDARTSIGIQGLKSDAKVDSISGSVLPAGATTLNAASVQASSFHASENNSTGVYAEEALAFGNTFFVTAGVRRDKASAFGADFRSTTYPSVGVSWALSEQDYFPKHTWLNTLRLRSAFGTAGQFPGAEDEVNIVQYVFPSSSDSVGAPRPEYSSEWEVGADARLFGGASMFNLTYSHKKTIDLFVPLLILPGFPPLTRDINGADVENSGLEVTLQQRLVNRAKISASVNVTGSTNKNRLSRLAKDVPPIFTGSRTTEKNTPGYPLFGLWSRTYMFDDANKDGIVTANEMTFGDTAQFMASSFPTRALVISPSVEVLDHQLRFTAQVDSKWGFKKFNNTLRHQCQTARSCRGLNDQSASLATQAAAVAATQSVFSGMLEDASFTRLREVSVSYELPTNWATTFRASGWNVALTGRNLGVATKYSGSDPEASISTTDARTDEYFSTPLMRYYTLRFNLRF